MTVLTFPSNPSVNDIHNHEGRSWQFDGTGWRLVVAMVPVGAIFHFALNTAPTGYLKANGAAVSRTTYAALFAVIGTTFGVGDGSTTFNLPDLRGEFIRGWADDRSVDTGRSFGSAQADELELHGHPFITAVGGGSESSGGLLLEASSNVSHEAFTGSVGSNRGEQIGGTGGAETRPRNIALLACIKY